MTVGISMDFGGPQRHSVEAFGPQDSWIRLAKCGYNGQNNFRILCSVMVRACVCVVVPV